MKNYSYIILLSFSCLINSALASARVSAQDNPFNRKLIWGGVFQLAKNGMEGTQLPGTFFYKPGTGLGVLLEYYPVKWLGFGCGVGYSSKGPGKINPDYDQSLGNPDSTFREHYYFRTLDAPIFLSLRGPDLLSEKVRISSRIGTGFSKNFRSTNVFHSVEDGFHKVQNVTNDFYNTDIYTYCALGLDFNSGTHTLFQIHAFWQRGYKNVFANNQKYGPFFGVNQSFGIQFNILY